MKQELTDRDARALAAIEQIAQGLRNAKVPFKADYVNARLTISGFEIVDNASTIQNTFMARVEEAQENAQ